MTIYADILVVTNLYIDFFLLWCVKKFLKLRTKNWRLVLGALTGALCALLSLIPGQPPWLSLTVSIASALLTAASAFLPVRLRMFGKSAACLWGFSFLLAGFFLFLLRFFSPGNVAVLGQVVYFDLSPPLLFFFTCGAYLVFRLLQRLFPRETSSLRYLYLSVEYRGKRKELFAKADTGSALREPFSGLPVVVCEAASLQEIAPACALSFWETEKAGPETSFGLSLSGEERLRLVPFASVGGSGVLPAFLPDQVTVKKSGAKLECYLALYPKKLSSGQFNALFNPDLFPEHF